MAGEKNATVANVREKTGLPEDVIQHAFAIEKHHPRQANSSEVKDAQAFRADTVEHKDEHRSIEHLAKQINTIGPEARAMFDALPPEERAMAQGRWESYRARMYQVIDAYQRLPVERDAYSAEGQLSANKK
jgi:hypothetical protein